MSEQSNLSIEDRDRLDTLTVVAIATCRAAGLSNDALIASATTEIVVDKLVGFARTGDRQVSRLLRHLLVAAIVGWMEEEDATGRSVAGTTRAVVERMLADVVRQRRPEA